jgi:hypothetical protein
MLNFQTLIIFGLQMNRICFENLIYWSRKLDNMIKNVRGTMLAIARLA